MLNVSFITFFAICHLSTALPWNGMDKPRRDKRAGGALFALSILAGVIGGMAMGQPSIGVLAGAAVGLMLLLLIWLVDRR